MVRIEFTERMRERAVAEARRRSLMQRDVPQRNGGKKDAKADLYGAAGELAVATYLGFPCFELKAARRGSEDLRGGIEVKTAMKHSHRLIVQLDDRPGKDYWLVTIEGKEVWIHGWLPWGEVARLEYVADPVGGRAAYFVPSEFLYAPETWRHGF